MSNNAIINRGIQIDSPNDLYKILKKYPYICKEELNKFKQTYFLVLHGCGCNREKNKSLSEQIYLNLDKVSDKIKSEFNRYRTHIRKNYPDEYKKFQLNEARYTEFKKKSQFRTPTQQLHMAVREIRRKIDEMTKVVAFTERMRTELKASNEGMSYLNRTRESISRINEKLQELNNRIKNLTE